MIADGAGRAVAFALAPGQAHELPMATALLARLPGVAAWVVGDRGYSANSLREAIWDSGARPAKINEAVVACPDWIYTDDRGSVIRLRVRKRSALYWERGERPIPVWWRNTKSQ